MVDAFNFDMQDTFNKCVKLVKKWTPELVDRYRIHAQQVANPQIFVDKLNEETARILRE